MNARERFLTVMRFEKDAPVLKAEYGYWVTAIKNFIREGMPVAAPLAKEIPDNGTISGAVSVGEFDKTIADVNVRAACGLDPYPAKFPMDASPRLKPEIIELGDGYRIFRDSFGILKKELTGGTSTPLDLEFPIKSRKDFEAYKEGYAGPIQRRLPENWDAEKKKILNRDYPLRLGGFPFGFLGFPRHLIGTAELFMMMYDDPDLIKEMNEFFLRFIMEYWDILIKDLRPDVVLIWEDMASKTGSMISKEMFKEFLSPYYIRLIDFLKQHRVPNIHVDSDGYIEDLIPLWVNLGVTGIFPFERQAGNDLLRIREAFPRMQIMGGVDKRIFANGQSRKSIDAELEITKKLLAQGGCLPHADHHVPDDSSWENFYYYRTRLNDIIDSSTKGGA